MQKRIDADLTRRIMDQVVNGAENIESFGESIRGRLLGQILYRRTSFNRKREDIAVEKHHIGMFAGSNSLFFYDGDTVLYRFPYASIHVAQWKDTSFTGPPFQRWMLWEFGGKTSDDEIIHLCVATYALAISNSDSHVADLFHSSLKESPAQPHGISILKNFNAEDTTASKILPYISDITADNMLN